MTRAPLALVYTARLRRPPLRAFDATRGFPGEGHPPCMLMLMAAACCCNRSSGTGRRWQAADSESHGAGWPSTERCAAPSGRGASAGAWPAGAPGAGAGGCIPKTGGAPPQLSALAPTRAWAYPLFCTPTGTCVNGSGWTTMEFDSTRGFPGEGHHRGRRLAFSMAFWNANTLREAYEVRADGTLAASGDIGKLPMLVGALEDRGIYACGVAEHRRMGDAIEDLPGEWTFVRTCTVATTGPNYGGGVGILLSPRRLATVA